MYRLIVVDDDVDAVNNIAKDFPWEQSGFTLVGSFQDGESALAWLKTHTVDLILCDIKMARMNGIELARQMQQAHRKEKLVFISGFKDFDYAQKALEYGVFATASSRSHSGRCKRPSPRFARRLSASEAFICLPIARTPARRTATASPM